MIQIDDLEFAYPGQAFCLRIPRLHIDGGRKIAVVGPSGSGKTTLLHLMAGILVPVSGSVAVNNALVSVMGESARRDFRLSAIGLVFQEFELLEHLNVLDNILLPCRISRAIRLRSHHRDRAIDLAREMGIDGQLRRFVRRLSQGERQRVAICRALLLEPALLLCDEPTGNLDPANKEHVLNMLFQHVARSRATLVAVTHDHQLLPRFDEAIDFAQLQHGEANPP